jgi:hypothetical protein
MPNYGYFLPLAESTFRSVRFLDLSPKTELVNGQLTPKLTKEGVPQYLLSALVKYEDEKPQTEVFTITLDDKQVNLVRTISELTPIRLIGLRGGKWSRQQSDQTTWSFQITGVEVLK